MQVQQQKKCHTKMKRKTQEHRSSNQKYLTCQAKPFSGIKLIFFLCSLKFKPTHSRNKIYTIVKNEYVKEKHFKETKRHC